MSISSFAADKEVQLGDNIAAFAANDDQGNLWTTTDSFRSKYLIVYFYPAAMTPGCTKQACAYRDDAKKLSEAGAQVVGVSGDSVKNLVAFKNMHNLNFPLLSDVNSVIAHRFGVPSRKGGSINRQIDGTKQDFTRSYSASRWTFIINKEGKVLYKNTKVNAAKDSKSILEIIQGLK